jgi:hypothetical protein
VGLHRISLFHVYACFAIHCFWISSSALQNNENKMKSNWQTFKDFIRTKEEGSIITRKELHEELCNKYDKQNMWCGMPTTTCYMCVKNLFNGGFMKSAGWGKYQILVHPPEELTIGDCDLIKNGDNLTYIEKLQKRKDKQKRKEGSK